MNFFVARVMSAVELGLRIYDFLFVTCWSKILDTFRGMMKGRLNAVIVIWRCEISLKVMHTILQIIMTFSAKV